MGAVKGTLFVLLSDFGFMNRKGGTPLLASPECQIGTLIQKSDLYSLGGCFIHLVSNSQLFSMLMMSPLLTKKEIKLAEKIKNNPIIDLALKMRNPDQSKRPEIESVIEQLEAIDEKWFNRNLIDNPDIVKLMELWVNNKSKDISITMKRCLKEHINDIK